MHLPFPLRYYTRRDPLTPCPHLWQVASFVSDMRQKSRADFGLFTYSTTSGRRLYGVRLRIQGRLWKRQGFPTLTAAKAFRDKVRAERYEGTFFPDKYASRRARRVTVAEIVELVIKDYERNGYKSLKSAKELAGFWRREAGALPVSALTTGQLRAWADAWLARGRSPARVNRCMTHLFRGLRLAQQERLLPTNWPWPQWHRLKEAPPRSGFIEYPAYRRLLTVLPEYARVPVAIGFWTGMRWGEIRSLRWEQVTFDHAAKTVRLTLAGEQTKTSEARVVAMPGELYELLAAWQQQTQTTAPACPLVCHRAGRPLRSITTIWKTAWVTLGEATGKRGAADSSWRSYRGPLFHDLRRSGIRNLVRAGVPERIAMAISGHKTRSVFDRYNIVSERDIEQAGRLVAALLTRQTPSIPSSIPPVPTHQHSGTAHGNMHDVSTR